jgi:hypothetical protein
MSGPFSELRQDATRGRLALGDDGAIGRWTDWAMLTSITIRVTAGAAGALPALLALALLDRAAFGHATANYAWALLLTGPVLRFLGQAYFRDLISFAREPRSPQGSAFIPLYALAMTGPTCALAWFGALTWTDAGFVMLNVLIVIASRMQESWFVAHGRPTAAILLFYLFPPLLHAILILVLLPAAASEQFWLVAVTQVVSYGGCVIAGVAMQPPQGRRQLLPHTASRRAGWRAEWTAVRQFFASGALLAATEQLPIVLLSLFGFRALIPTFQVARKLAAVPDVLIHALNMHMMPRLVNYADSGRWTEFRRVLRSFSLTSAGLSCAYIAVAVVAVYAFSRLSPDSMHIEFPFFAILFGAALINAVTGPLGSVTVLQGDLWWMIGGGLSLLSQLCVSMLALGGLGPLAIPLSVLAQVIVIRAITGMAAVLLLQEKERESVARLSA